MTPDDWVSQYRSMRPQFEKLCRKTDRLLRDLLAQNEIGAQYEYRAKSVESFSEKIRREGKDYSNPLKDVTDLAGVRLIVHSLEDVEKTAQIIQREFDVDETRSLNKIDQLDPDRFGYLSQHYIATINRSRLGLPEWSDLKGLILEIQVRTTMQHAWAVIQHALDYKNTGDVPKKLRRRLYRVSALLELADEELNLFSKEVRSTIAEYRTDLTQGNAGIELDVESLRIYLEYSLEIKYWVDFLKKTTHQEVSGLGDLSRDIRFAHFVGITQLTQLGELLFAARGWGERFFESYYRRYFLEHNTTPDKVVTVVNGVVTQLIIATYFEKFTAEILRTQFGWGTHFILEEAASARNPSI